MTSKWKETSFSDILEIKTGKLDSNQAEEHGQYPFFTCSPQTLRINKYAFDEEAVLLAGNNANGVFSVKYYDGKFNAYQRTYIISPKDYDSLNCKYCYYQIHLLTNFFKDISIGTATKFLTLKMLNKMTITLPSLAEQKAIAHILGSLDDKIELNRQMNETLEAMAQAIFKSWFVDFDPVIDNALQAGNPIPEELSKKADKRKEVMASPEYKKHKLPKDIMKLFPDSFVDSALGSIPKGWTISLLGDIVDIKHGYAFKGKHITTEPNNDIVLTPGNFAVGGGFKGDKFKYYDDSYPDEYILKSGDLLVTMTDLSKKCDTLGYPAIVPETEGIRYLHNQRLGKVIINEGAVAGKMFLYYLLRTKAYRSEVLASITGTTVKHTSPKRIEAFSFALPKIELLSTYESHVEAIHKLIDNNNEKSNTLVPLRDTLLPKLISGELSVKKGHVL